MDLRSLRRRASQMIGLDQRGVDVYTLLDWNLEVKVGGILWLVAATATAVIFPFAPPTNFIGPPGWAVACALWLMANVFGVYLLRRGGAVRPLVILGMGYCAVCALATAQVLVGPDVQLAMAYLLTAAYHAAVHPARRALPLLGCILVVQTTSIAVGGPDTLELVQTLATACLIVLMTTMTLIYARLHRSLAAELHAQRADAEQRAATDPLTGLGNRRAFDEALMRHVAASARSGAALSLIMFDIDRFKAINDRLGHHAGDSALVAVAAAISAEVRAADACFRWGGDEFAVILPSARLEAAEEVARRIAAAVPRTGVLPGDRPLSVSSGVAALHIGEHSYDLLERADAALFAAKRGEPAGASAARA